MKGSITERRPGVFTLKWDLGRDPITGKRRQRYCTVKGGRRDARGKLAEIIASIRQAKYVDPSKITLGDCADEWLEWVTGDAEIRAKTVERYRQLVEKQIRPRLGAVPVQKITDVSLESFYRTLETEGRDNGKGLSRRTVNHAHRIVHAILKRAVKRRLVLSNAAEAADAPSVPHENVETFAADEIRMILDAFRPRPLYTLVSLAFDTGLRRGELCALRWRNIDLSKGTLSVIASLSKTKEGPTFEDPKTASGKRTISLTASSITELTAHRKAQLEQRVSLGLGKLPDDALVFPSPDEGPRDPDAISRGWSRVLAGIEVKKLSFHATRHSHASRLIAAGVDVVTVSKRLGHANPAITLKVYSHLFGDTDAKAAEAIDKALTR